MTTYDQSARKPLGAWIPSLYFAQGLPFFTIAALAKVYYQQRGLSNDVITLYASLLLWPWTLKPAWGPLIEMFKTKKFFIVTTQLLGGASLLVLAFSATLPGFLVWSLALLGLIAFCSSTHDIAADGLYITTLDARQQATWVGWLGAFFNGARAFVGFGLVYLAGEIAERAGVTTAWATVFGLLGGILLALGLYHARVLPTGGTERRTESLQQAYRTFLDVLVTFFQKPSIWLFIAFIFLFRAGEGQLQALAQLFLLNPRDTGGLGLTLKEYGWIYGFFGTIAFVIGSILGGRFTASVGLKRALIPLIFVMNLPNAAYLYLAVAQPTNHVVIGAALFVEMFGYGFGFVGLTLLMMQEVAPGKYEAAHYAISTAVMNLGFMLPGMISGKIQMSVGYPMFFAWILLWSIPPLVLARLLPFRHGEPVAPLKGAAAEPAQA